MCLREPMLLYSSSRMRHYVPSQNATSSLVLKNYNNKQTIRVRREGSNDSNSSGFPTLVAVEKSILSHCDLTEAHCRNVNNMYGQQVPVASSSSS